MIFGDLVKENKKEFFDKVIEICCFLQIKPDWLMFVMWFETGRTMNPKAVNPISGATGLIQFMPATARSLGTSTEALKKMTNVEQLPYVKKYLTPYKGRMKDWLDVYCAVFYPVLIGKPDNYVIDRSVVVRQNPIFDINKDGVIHKYEIRAALLKTVPVKYRDYLLKS